MGDFYDVTTSISMEINDLPSRVSLLYNAWHDKGRKGFELVDYLFTTARYTDNEFFRLLGQVRVGGDKSSVLHLRSYEQLEESFIKAWNTISNVVGPDFSQPVQQVAQQTIDLIRDKNVGSPTTVEAFGEDPEKAYRTLHPVVCDFVSDMQDSRFLLETETGTISVEKLREKLEEMEHKHIEAIKEEFNRLIGDARENATEPEEKEQ